MVTPISEMIKESPVPKIIAPIKLPYLDDELRHRRDEAEIMLTADARTIGIDEDSEYGDN